MKPLRLTAIIRRILTAIARSNGQYLTQRRTALALYEDCRNVSSLTSVNGDTITCTAQWKPVATGTKTFYMQFNANGGEGTAIPDLAVQYGVSTALPANTFTREGYTFSGWICHRRSDNKWAMKNSETYADCSAMYADKTDTMFLKAYTDGCTLAKTSSVDRDIVTMYAAWTRVVSPVFPSVITEDTEYLFGGTIDSDAGLCSVTATFTDENGNVVSTVSASPCTTSFDISTMTFAKLAQGNYRYVLKAETMNTADVRTEVTLLDKPIAVGTKAFFTEPKAESGATLKNGFISVRYGTDITSIPSAFNTQATVYGADGAAATDGNGIVDSSDYLKLKAYFCGEYKFD